MDLWLDVLFFIMEEMGVIDVVVVFMVCEG